MYYLYCVYNNELILSTLDKNEVIKKLEELELKDYHDYLDYSYHCEENLELPGDYYESYFIVYKNGYYDITNYHLLERL